MRRTERAPRQSRRRVSFIGVLGELFLTAGVIVMLFLAWQYWISDRVIGGEQNEIAQELSQQWDKGEGAPAPAPADRPDPGDPIVGTAPGNAQTFANLIVPRFGADYIRTVAEGIGVEDVLNTHAVGHYPGTAMPGDVGNAAFAAHRTGWGSSFIDIDKLQIGDSIYVETEDGWYRYEFRNLEYVLPTGVNVLAPVPQVPGAAASDRLITLTSCNPLHSISERFIAYGVYDTWYPRAGGVPPEIAGVVSS